MKPGLSAAKLVAQVRAESRPRRKEKKMRKAVEIGGVVAAAVLVAFGTTAIVMGGHGDTSDEKYALVNAETKRPVDNGLRNLWVTETALTTALNTSYMAEQLSLFGIVVGIALLLAGIGFAILAIGGALRSREPA